MGVIFEVNRISQCHRTRIKALVALAAAILTLAACGSSKGSGTQSNSGTASSSASSSASVTSARSLLSTYTQEPTQIGITVPLKAPPPPGKTIVFLRCELPQCGQFSDGIQSAAAAVGWHYKVITFQTADPSSLISGLTQALQYHPVAVSLAGIPQAVWQSVIPQYAAAGVPIIPLAIGQATLGQTVITNVLTYNDYVKLGDVNADWFIADSDGSGHALVVNIPTYDVLSAFTQGVTTTVTQHCPGCKVETLNLALSQVAGNMVNSAIISDLQKDPSIKYVITSNGPFVNGLVSALQAAGIAGIKIRETPRASLTNRRCSTGQRTRSPERTTATRAGRSWMRLYVTSRGCRSLPTRVALQSGC